MTFSQKRFVDIGQTLYLEWMKTVSGLNTASEQERREVFKMASQFAFEAAEEFTKVFDNQEDT